VFFLLLKQWLLPASLYPEAHMENPQESVIALDQIDRVLLHGAWRPSNAMHGANKIIDRITLSASLTQRSLAGLRPSVGPQIGQMSFLPPVPIYTNDSRAGVALR
jgi:hypothetical protein